MSDARPLFTFASLNVLELHPDPAQPREIRNEQSDKELGESMRLNGMLQPYWHAMTPASTSSSTASGVGAKHRCWAGRTTADSTHALSLHLIESRPNSANQTEKKNYDQRKPE